MVKGASSKRIINLKKIDSDIKTETQSNKGVTETLFPMLKKDELFLTSEIDADLI